MARPRHELLDWAEQGRIAPQRLRRALELAGVLPDGAAWRGFLDRLLLWLGVVMLASGAIFFLAYNWQALGRYAKFALVEGLLAAALGVVGWQGIERPAGKAALLGAALMVGALLALIGQTYQTGADTFELFAAWALAILPWVLVARLPALWVLWLGLANLAVVLYFQAFHGLFGIVFGPERQIWLLFALDTAAVAAWEGFAARGIAWLRERWAVRVVATASGALAAALAVLDILEQGGMPGWGVPAWLAWIGAAYALYRRRLRDLYMLAGGVLSVIVVVTTFLGDRLLGGRSEAGGFLLIGLVVIGLSAAGGVWLKAIASEEEPA